MPCSVQELWDFHASPGAFAAINPPFSPVRPEGPLPLVAGSRHRFRVLRLFSFSVELVEAVEPEGFVDVLDAGWIRWRHHHRFEAAGEGSWLVDDFSYECWLPIGFVMDRMFAFRHAQTLRALSSGSGGR